MSRISSRSFAVNSSQQQIVEVGARDGLQSESSISLSDRISFINRLTKCNFPHIEVGSMVKLDSMKSSDYVYDQIDKKSNIEYSLLTLNTRGLDNCLHVKPNTVSVVVSPSETFCQKNMGHSLDIVKNNVTKIQDSVRAFACNMRVNILFKY